MKKTLVFLLVSFLFITCSKSDDSNDSDNNDPDKVLSSEKQIISFKINFGGALYETEIRNDSILAILPSSVDLSKLTPEITVSDNASVNPASGVVQDFTNGVAYKVTAENNTTKTYNAVITKINSGNTIIQFSFTNLAPGLARYSILNKNPADIDTISYNVSYLSPIKALTSNIFISQNATIEPASGETLDYSQPIKYTVTSEEGNKKEYLVMVDNSLIQLKINGITANTYRNKKPSEVISFKTNVLNPIKDSIQVKLLSNDGLKNIDLEVQSIDLETNEIKVKLPATYENDGFRFKVFIEHDNFDESDGFVLDGGSPNFKFVQDDYDNGNYLVYNTLLIPGERFNSSVYVNRDNFNNHNFYLRKNGQDYPFTGASLDTNFSRVYLEMPSLPNSTLQGGTDFEVVIKYEGQDYTFPLLNSNGNPIDVIVAKAPVVNSVSSTTIKKGETITVNGENLYYPFYNGTIPNKNSKLELRQVGSTSTLVQDGLNSDGSITFTVSDNIQTGEYVLAFKNNINDFSIVETGIEISVVLPESNHPTLIVTEAKVYSSSSPTLPKQILVSFNGNITEVDVKKIEIGPSFNSITIENFSTNTSTILTGALSTQDYNTAYIRIYDGFVVLEDQGVEYKLPFKLVRN